MLWIFSISINDIIRYRIQAACKNSCLPQVNIFSVFFQSNEWPGAPIKTLLAPRISYSGNCVCVNPLFGWVDVGGWLGVIINSVHAAKAASARYSESVCFYPTTRLPENSLEEGGNDEVSSWSLAERGYKLLPACDVYAARAEREASDQPTKWELRDIKTRAPNQPSVPGWNFTPALRIGLEIAAPKAAQRRGQGRRIFSLQKIFKLP